MEAEALTIPAETNSSQYTVLALESTRSHGDYAYKGREQFTADAEIKPIFKQNLDMYSFLLGEIGPGLNLIKPLMVKIERENDYFIVSESIFGVYGVGDTIREGVQDYEVSLFEFFELISQRARENPHNIDLLNKLEEYISG